MSEPRPPSPPPEPTELNRLREELEQARRTINDLTAERDSYLRALYALTREEVSFTEEDRQEIETSGLTLGMVIEELEKIAEQEYGRRPS